MRNRTFARELAIQALYLLDLRGEETEKEIEEFCRQKAEKPDIYKFALSLITGCISHRVEIDEKISLSAENWDLHRMAIIDKNILRLGVYELLYRDDIPPKVSINEAIELAKKFSTKDSGMFVNGVLDKVYNSLRNKKTADTAKEEKETVFGISDLHIHTNYSDGTTTPEEVVDEAIRLGLSAIAITDHDTIQGFLRAEAYKNGKKLYIIPGIEISSFLDPSEIHILGYFIDIHNDALNEVIKKARKDRVERIYAMTEKLRGLRVNINPLEVLDLAGEGTPGRMHMAEIIWRNGYTTTLLESFYKYIGDKAPAYVPKKTLTPREAIELIRGAKGVPVLAHPGLTQRDNVIEDLVKYGLQGIEAYYPTYTKTTVEKYLKLAKKYNLVVTGGSDFHGERKVDNPIAKVTISGNLVKLLKQRCSNN
ncbi:MAG: transcription antitermination factor NusB [Candidatus Kuenenia sp.]|nr:transcription antitermination factor NusB [Candidatus Kuenenia hertensis]